MLRVFFEGVNQRKTKGQQLKGKIVSALFHTFLGNGRNTVSRVLFRRRELTEPHWVLGQTRWVLRKTRWVRVYTQIIGWKELTELAPRNSVSPEKTHWVRCLKPCSPKPYSARFRFLALSHTFSHFFTLFQSFSEFLLQGFFLELRGFTAVLVQR